MFKIRRMEKTEKTPGKNQHGRVVDVVYVGDDDHDNFDFKC